MKNEEKVKIFEQAIVMFEQIKNDPSMENRPIGFCLVLKFVLINQKYNKIGRSIDKAINETSSSELFDSAYIIHKKLYNTKGDFAILQQISNKKPEILTNSPYWFDSYDRDIRIEVLQEAIEILNNKKVCSKSFLTNCLTSLRNFLRTIKFCF